MVYELITPESHFDGIIFADGDCPTTLFPWASCGRAVP